jgi:hypothetical protein
MSEMSNEQKGCLGCGGIIACIFIISLLVQLAKAYYDNVAAGNVVLGILVGMATGIGIGAVVGGLGDSVYRKSFLGPLPTMSYLRSVAWLEHTYEIPIDAIVLDKND